MIEHSPGSSPAHGPVIGWRELLAFPEWGVKGIVAKIDTGARTGAIHVEDIVRLKNGRVRFHLVTSRRRPFRHVLVRADVVRVTRIRSSTGHRQERIVVATKIRLAGVVRRIEMSLVRRDDMLCRMLLGRTALGDFLIDVNQRHLHGTRRNRKEPLK